MLSQLLINGFVAGLIYVLIALSYNLFYKAIKFSNLAFAGVLAVGSYVAFYLTNCYQMDLWIACLIGSISAGFSGLFLEKIIFLPLRRKRASKMVLFITSLGVMMTIQAVLAILFSSQSKNLLPVEIIPTVYPILGGVINQTQILIMLINTVVILVFTLVFKLTSFGKVVRAISDDEDVAKLIGINTEKYLGFVFFVTSFIMGLAGILISFDTGMEPLMGFDFLFKGIIASIIGGANYFIGAMVGAFFLGFIENLWIREKTYL